MTIDKVKADILAGRSKKIYHSSGTLWWTHLIKDVMEATELGKKASDIRHQMLLDNPNVNEMAKARIKVMKELIKSNSHKVPLDPTGAPLRVIHDPLKWITFAEENSGSFALGGLGAFMKAHHQNCDGKYLKNWKDYAALLTKPGNIRIIK